MAADASAPVKPTAVDRHIAAELRRRRQSVKLSQSALADALGLTFQQVQKYENARNRIAASRLWEIACALECEIGDFYPAVRGADRKLPAADGPRVSAHALPLAKMYDQLSSPSRSLVAQLIRTLHERDQS